MIVPLAESKTVALARCDHELGAGASRSLDERDVVDGSHQRSHGDNGVRDHTLDTARSFMSLLSFPSRLDVSFSNVLLRNERKEKTLRVV